MCTLSPNSYEKINFIYLCINTDWQAKGMNNNVAKCCKLVNEVYARVRYTVLITLCKLKWFQRKQKEKSSLNFACLNENPFTKQDNQWTLILYHF